MKSYIFTVLCLVGMSLSLDADISSVDDLNHVVEKSRVVSMRIIKVHALESIKNRYKNPKEELESSFRLLKSNLNNIDQYLKSHASEVDPSILVLIDEARKHLAKLEKDDLLHDTSNEHAVAFFKAVEKCRVKVNKVAEILTKDKSKRDPVFFTTRIATIGQKMAAVYLYKAWGIPLPDLDKHFAMMIKKSTKSIKALHTFVNASKIDFSDADKAQANRSIESMQKQLNFFIMSKSMKRFIPALICKKADTIEQEGIKIEKLLMK